MILNYSYFSILRIGKFVPFVIGVKAHVFGGNPKTAVRIKALLSWHTMTGEAQSEQHAGCTNVVHADDGYIYGYDNRA